LSGRQPSPSAPRPSAAASPQAILAQALALRSQIAEVLARAGSSPQPVREAPPSREGLLRQAISLYMEVERTRDRAEQVAQAKQQLEVLAEASELLGAFQETRDRYDRAITIAARQMLLRQLTDLRQQVMHALARVRLIPDMIQV
jgi:hypothetical protein